MMTDDRLDGPTLTVVVPAWNEEGNLPACLATLVATLAGTPFEVIVVDDGSADRTLEVAREFAAAHPGSVRVLGHAGNQGLGAALKTGFAAAKGRYVTLCPADFLMTHDDWAPFGDALGRADVLVGCRLRREGYNPLMLVNSWLYPKLVAALFGLRLRDVNWISVYRLDLVRRAEITQRGIPMLAEILVRLRDLGATILEVDCRMQPRTIGTPSAARPRVMWRTLKGLIELRRTYRPRATTGYRRDDPAIGNALPPPHGEADRSAGLRPRVDRTTVSDSERDLG